MVRMKYTEDKYWLCRDCNVEFKSTDDHHNLDMCPKCRRNGIDHESYCIRMIGNVDEIKGRIKEYKFTIGTTFTIFAKNKKEAFKKAEEYEPDNLELVPLF